MKPHIYPHIWCISPLRLVEQASQLPGSEPFIRQVVWRDFYAQILNMHQPRLGTITGCRGDVWQYDPAAYESWVEGNTGFPLVDAACVNSRQSALCTTGYVW